MKTFSNFIKESKKRNNVLTDDSLSKMSYLKKHLTNEQINEIFNKYVLDKSDFENNFIVDMNKLNEMLANKGISSFGPIKDSSKYILKLFKNYDKLNVLNDILKKYENKNDNSFSISKLKKRGNIFNDFCSNWKDVAIDLANITYKETVNVGPYEVLLKFILKEAGTGKSGDISINGSDDFEVKCMSWSKNKSGGHLVGQKKFGDQRVRKSWAIYMYINEKLFGVENNRNDIADKSAYFQKESGFNSFKKQMLEKLENNEITNDDISKVLVNSLCYQYNFINNVRDNGNLGDSPELSQNIINELYKQTKKQIGDPKTLTFEKIKNIIGCVQLHLYSFIEDFDYLFVGFYSTRSDKSSQNGQYYFIEKKNNPVIDFDDLLDDIYFGPLETTEQGRTGKIYIHLK